MASSIPPPISGQETFPRVAADTSKKPLPPRPPQKGGSSPTAANSPVFNSIEKEKEVAGQAFVAQAASQEMALVKAEVQRYLTDGKAHQDNKKKEKAKASYQQAIDLAKKRLNSNDPLIAESLLAMGEFLIKKHEKEAFGFYEEARILCSKHQHSPKLLSRAYVGLAEIAYYAKPSNFNEMFRCLEAVFALGEEENRTTAQAYMLMSFYCASQGTSYKGGNTIFWLDKANALYKKLDKK